MTGTKGWRMTDEEMRAEVVRIRVGLSDDNPASKQKALDEAWAATGRLLAHCASRAAPSGAEVESAGSLYLRIIDPDTSDEVCIAGIEQDRAAVAQRASVEGAIFAIQDVADAYELRSMRHEPREAFEQAIASVRAKYAAKGAT